MIRCLVLFLLLVVPVCAQPLAPLKGLVGDWVGDNGRFSFAYDLGDHVLVRHNHAEYPGQPAHDDLMVVFPDQGGVRADYFDNEGHVIHYRVTCSAEGAVFESDGPGPRFRLTYAMKSPDLVDVRFEIAPPGKDYATYLQAQCHRAGSHP